MRDAIYQEPDLDPTARSAIWPHRPSHWRPGHFHGELELNLVLQGTGRMRLAGRELTVSRGVLAWMPTGQSHELLSASADYRMWVVAFRDELVERVRQTLPQPKDRPELRLAQQLDAATLAALDARLSWAASGAVATTTADDVAAEALRCCLLAPAQPVAGHAPLHPLVRRGLATLGSAPERPCRAVAAQVGVTAEHLSRLFQQELAASPNELRQRHRLARFVALVSQGHDCTRAALAAGFGSYSQLHRVFVARVGVSPSRYFDAAVRRRYGELTRANDLS